MPERVDSEGVIKKRQPVPKSNSFGGVGGGYSTDESGASYSPTSKDSSSSKRRHRRRADVDKDSIGKASLIWMVLIIGLVFCLMDAAYIARVLDRGPSIEEETNIMAADMVMQQFRRAQSMTAQLHRQDFSQADESASASASAHARAPKPHSSPIKQHEQKQHQHGHLPTTREEMEHAAHQGTNIRRRGGGLSVEERAKRLAQQQKEKEEAEAKRIKNIKMAALEALKAEHGGKIPDDMINKALEDEEAFKPRPMDYYKTAAIEDDKDRILGLFVDAGLKEMDDSTYKVLPKWSDVKRLYGDEPKIIGLEQCETFRAKGNPWDHFVSTAGTFNSGTNLMAEMLIHNCHMEERMKKLGHQNRGIRWQVPWGKHTPPGDEQYRLEHKSMKDKDVDANMILPAVTVRDPYYWMQSMCKHHYTASWRSSDRCPNLIPTPQDQATYPMLRDKDYFPLSVRYADFHRHHQSLTGLWNDWYNEYKGVEFQRLFVRYEDLLFHPKTVTKTVCLCAGGTMNKGKFVYQVDSAKKGIGAHGNIRTGYVDAIIKYGSERNRYNGYHAEDLKYAREHLDVAMMEDFGYKYHPMSLENGGADAEEDSGENGGNEHGDDSDEEGDANAEHEEEKEAPEEPGDEEEEEEPEKSEDIGDKEDQEEEKLEDVVDEDEEDQQ